MRLRTTRLSISNDASMVSKDAEVAPNKPFIVSNDAAIVPNGTAYAANDTTVATNNETAARIREAASTRRAINKACSRSVSFGLGRWIRAVKPPQLTLRLQSKPALLGVLNQ